MLTMKDRKEEIYKAYVELLEQKQSNVIRTDQFLPTAQLIAKESQLLVRDCRTAGSLAGQWISGVVADLRKPVLRSVA